MRYLVGGDWNHRMDGLTFQNIDWECLIIPTDFHIFQRGRYTTNQVRICEPFKIDQNGIVDWVLFVGNYNYYLGDWGLSQG